MTAPADSPARFAIAGRELGAGQPCYLIAEAGVNHFGDLPKAFALAELALAAGCDAVKFQHFSTDRLVGPSAPDWRTRLRSKELPDSAMLAIAEHCRKIGITFMCTGHEERALDFLVREAKIPALKIGSGELENWPYLEQAASYGLPIILSTGMYTLEQVAETIQVLKRAGNRELAILHCVTSYPADVSTINLKAMQQIRGIFSGPVGYSDHTAGDYVPLAAVALGAEVIEKHITLDVDVPNAQDWKVSATADTLAPFVRGVRQIEAALGGGPKLPSPAEVDSMHWATKSITLVRDLEAGHVVGRDDVAFQRPGGGLRPSQLSRVLGKRLKQSLPAGALLQEAALES